MRTLVLLVLLRSIAFASADDLAAAISAKNKRAIAGMLADRINSQGIWFPDAACTKKFGAPRILETSDHAQLAACLAKLEVQPADRKSGSVHGSILAFSPGIELEIGESGGKIYYLGAAGRRDERPTLTTKALEALRTKGTTNLDDVVAAKLEKIATRGPVDMWIAVCFDKTGTVSFDAAERTPSEIEDAFLPAVRASWAFSPFMYKKKPLEACGMTRLAYPSTAKLRGADRLLGKYLEPPKEEDGEVGFYGEIEESAPMSRYASVAPEVLEKRRTGGDPKIVPDDSTKEAIRKSKVGTIAGSFELCTDAKGAVTDVTKRKGTRFFEYDEKIERTMRTWTFSPWTENGKDVPVCTTVTFEYSAR